MRVLSVFSLFAAINLFAQSDEQLASYLKRNPAADANGDGKLTRQEARDHRRRDPSRGDNLASRSHIPGVQVSESDSPLKNVRLKSPDGVTLDFAYRKPKGDGPFPTILFFHGGGGYSGLDGLRKNLLNGAVQTRFLARGFVTVQSTRRPYWSSKKGDRPTGFHDAVEDARLVVDKVKTLAGVDRDRVVLYGGSGGGILAVVTASKADVACVIAGEPATVVALEPMTGKVATPGNYRSIMERPHEKFTGERKKEMRAWMKQIDAPVLLLQGKHVGLYKSNFEILIPEMKKLGKDISHIDYPGLSHGFYWGTVKTGATKATVEKILKDTTTFIARHTDR